MSIVDVKEFCYPSRFGGQVCLKFVLTFGAVKDWAVYAGSGPTEWVAAQGDKVPFEVAKTYFPHLNKEEYRN